MKISGISLMPAATPIPMPFHQCCLGSSRSTTMSSMSRTLIWPRARFPCTGSVSRAAAVTSRVAPDRARRPGIAQRAEGQPHRQREGAEAGQGHGPAQRGPRQQRPDREHDRRERRVGEGDGVWPVPGVQRRVGVRVVRRRNVPGDQAAGPVDGQVPHLGHPGQVVQPGWRRTGPAPGGAKRYRRPAAIARHDGRIGRPCLPGGNCVPCLCHRIPSAGRRRKCAGRLKRRAVRRLRGAIRRPSPMISVPAAAAR